ncbi:MAG: D-serine deaminase, pyridoxal phosphate-dependent [Verrucomicrobia bacterium]|jgi:D-serine deaminase-like pyridoxal phosphate-dependent protein|nr:MAG: D-serine deaminase, pyridoxal phosphate-dependent [Verrucomicrobiota bacterium]
MNPPSPWYRLENPETVPSPALLIFPDRVAANIRRMVQIVNGDTSRLRPHVKTHKMAEIMRMQIDAGITKYKAATIAEAELAAESGSADVLLAYQPVGPNIERLAKLREKFPQTSFAAIVDAESVLWALSRRFQADPLRVFIDVDCGMHRTGIPVGEAAGLYWKAASTPGVIAEGLHVYDGHIHDADLADRERAMRHAFAPVHDLVAEIRPKTVIGGGSPTFALHAGLETWECSPGTTLLWDAGYGGRHPDLGFEPAVCLLTRVISKPSVGRLCLDLGHKAVAAEGPLARRASFPDLKDAEPVMHSEEHLVLECPGTETIELGTPLYALPGHVCPTVALHMETVLVRDGKATGETWAVRARNRRITI